ERWMIETRDKLSRGHDLTKAFNYMLRRWSSFTRFLDDGQICLSNNAAERALRGIDPQAWLADILARIAAHPAHRIDDLLPWNWRSAQLRTQSAAA
ncbi:transposase, partial [Mesorhizobium sp. M0909]|uniref:IS66 family transposase n=1 Tax=Mesorhizobium sp. M0909 TaxID=2957024 RepID=UPI0033387092